MYIFIFFWNCSKDLSCWWLNQKHFISLSAAFLEFISKNSWEELGLQHLFNVSKSDNTTLTYRPSSKQVIKNDKDKTIYLNKKIFPYNSHFKRHFLIHTGEKPFSCSHCRRAFAQKCDLNKHLRIHTGDKPYTCSVCNKSFSSNILKLHLRTHTGEKPFTCKFCSKSFSQLWVLKRHTQNLYSVEKPETCSLCHKSFSKGQLKLHLRTHTETPYNCPYCSKSFSQFGNLKRHTSNIHSGEKP